MERDAVNWRAHKFQRAKRNAPEFRFHVDVAKYLNVALPLDATWSTTPTVYSSVVQGARLKAMGYRKGWPDLAIIWQSRAYFFELKSTTGTVDPDQRACHGAINRAGGRVGLARDLNDIQFWLEQWGIPLRAVVDPRQLSGARSIA